jgi:peptidoglycan/xylan/chitin deacetylase (PgdA/CDA1 family)
MSLPDSYLQYPRRARGMDHDRYGYTSLFERAPVRWPDNARIALVVVPVLEWFPLDMVPAQMTVKAVGGMERPYPDYWNYTTRDYGTRVGVYRIFRVLEELGIPASVAINARLALRHPFLLREITRRDWEVVGQGLDMSHVAHGKTPEEDERRWIADALAQLRQASGQAVRGWLSPMQSESHHSLDLLRENGVDYTLDWNQDDLPVRMRTRAGDIHGVPYALDLNDRQSILDFNLSNADYVEQLVDAFTTLWREAADHGGRVMSVAAHSWLTGQPHRIRAFREALQVMRSHAGVWPTTYSRMLDAYIAQE